MPTQGSPIKTRVANLLADLEKRAGVRVKSAEAYTEAGGYSGGSDHPTAKVDDQAQDVSTGERAAEYTADTKDLVPAPVTVDATSDMSGEEGDQDKRQTDIGMSISAVGEDPSVEDNYKDTKDEPGSIGGETKTDLKYGTEKYSSWTFEQRRAKVSEVGNRLLKQAAASMKSAAAAKPATTPADVQTAAQAGYNAAALSGMNKAAAGQFLVNCQAEGERMADLTVWYLNNELAKQAGDPEAMAAEDHSAPGDVGSGANPGEAAGAEMLDSAAQAPPPDAGGQPSEDELLQAILELLAEKGISPEELMAQLGAGGGGGDPAAMGGDPGAAPGGMPGMPPGGMPPDMGGLPPEGAAAKMARAQKQIKLYHLANKVAAFKKSGKAYTPKARTNKVAGLKQNMSKALQDMLQLY